MTELFLSLQTKINWSKDKTKKNPRQITIPLNEKSSVTSNWVLMVSNISSMSGIMSKKQTAMKTPPEKQEAMVLNLELSSCLKTEKGAKGIKEHNALTRNMTIAKINFSVFGSIFFLNQVSFSVLTS